MILVGTIGRNSERTSHISHKSVRGIPQVCPLEILWKLMIPSGALEKIAK